MRESRRRSSVNSDDDRALVELLVRFANARPPATPGEVERLFRGHPYVACSPFWKSIDPEALGEADAHGTVGAASAVAFRIDQAELRAVLRQIAEDEIDLVATRQRIAKLLADDLAVSFKVGEQMFRLPLGQPVVSVVRRRLSLGFQPFLTGVQAAIWYGLALLVDPRRDLARGLAVCAAPGGNRETCGRFFWRRRGQLYCSPECSRIARRAANVRRQQAWRRKQR